MAIKKVFTVTVLCDDDADTLSFDDLIEEGQNGSTIYGTELVSSEVISNAEANKESIELGSDGTFFEVDDE